MEIDTIELNKKLFPDFKLSDKEMDFAFAKMDIEKKYVDLIKAEVDEVVRKHSKDYVNELLELYEKTREVPNG